MIKLLVVIKVAVLFSFVSSVNAEPSISFNDYKGAAHQRSCFSGPFGDYIHWRDSLINRKQYRSEKDREAARRRFSKDISRQEYDYFRKNLICNWFRYWVEGKMVNGYIIKKKSPAALPVLVYNRGGNGNYGATVFGAMFKRLFPIADQGFVIIGSQYRGTLMNEIDATFDDQFGGADVDDVLELLAVIPHIEGVDASRVGMLGSSRGGMQTLLALKAGANVKAVAILGAPTDLLAWLSDRPDMEEVFTKRISGYAGGKEKTLKQRSGVEWVDELDSNVPILVMHGQNDARVNANQSLAFASVLQQHNHPYKLVIYPGDDHGLNGHREEVNDELVKWFNRFLKEKQQ